MIEKKGGVMQMSATPTRCMEHERSARDLSSDPLSPARGIMLGCAISAGLWVGIVALAIS
ncbi:hypothetical protein [Aureimonas leprariae]|uniref:Uncharacterized protein n=1 Tax=Plantimonas leprariae TaxID=2615207 RepID=A0A7V7PQ62_9HYPH|nr:hypothetical protein [Aureimonas leprariae]KAB0680231.1 hypothetical protein F6X38_08600 [Aureimonas leprariae]